MTHTTRTDTEFHVSKLNFHEDGAGNPIHLVLIAVSILLFVLRRHQNQHARQYALSLLLAFLLFSLSQMAAIAQPSPSSAFCPFLAVHRTSDVPREKSPAREHTRGVVNAECVSLGVAQLISTCFREEQHFYYKQSRAILQESPEIG
jgi:hypothetical protein